MRGAIRCAQPASPVDRCLTLKRLETRVTPMHRNLPPAAVPVRIAFVLGVLGILQVAALDPLFATRAYAVTDVCTWDTLDWAEIPTQYQQAWRMLGWSQALWDSEGDAEPQSSAKDWTELTPAERAAAASVGYTSATWDEDGCGQ